MNLFLAIAALTAIAAGAVATAVRIEDNRCQQTKEAWIHTLTIFAGVTGTADPHEASRLARKVVAWLGVPRDKVDAAKALDVIFEAGARSGTSLPDPTVTPARFPWHFRQPGPRD